MSSKPRRWVTRNNRMADIPENKILHLNKRVSVLIAYSVLCPKKDYSMPRCVDLVSLISLAEVADYFCEYVFKNVV